MRLFILMVFTWFFFRSVTITTSIPIVKTELTLKTSTYFGHVSDHNYLLVTVKILVALHQLSESSGKQEMKNQSLLTALLDAGRDAISCFRVD